MPPSQVIWAGIYAFVLTLATSVAALYAQLSGTTTGIGKGAWIFSICGAVSAGFVAGKKSWDAYKLELVPIERVIRKYPE